MTKRKHRHAAPLTHRYTRAESITIRESAECLRSLDPKGTGQQRWITRWEPALNVLAIVFADRRPTTASH